MDLFDVVRACFRRWYIVLPMLVLTAWFSYGKYSSVEPVYYSQAVVGLAPPNAQVQYAQPGVPVARNGLLDGGGPVLLANMVVFGMRDPSVIDLVAAAGGSPSYWVKMFPTSEGQMQLPLIMVETSQRDPASARATLDLVIAQADPVLRDLQQRAGVAEEQRVRALVTSPPSAPVPAVPSRTKATVTTFLAGTGLSVLAGTVVDVVLTRRGARRNRIQRSDGIPRSEMEKVKAVAKT